jgi:peptidoglycan-associated lipoprotein
MIKPMIGTTAVKAGLVLLALVTLAACGSKEQPVARAVPPPPPPPPATSSSSTAVRPPAPPEPVPEPIVVPAEPGNLASASLDDLNKNSPLKPVFFAYDSVDISPEAQAALQENAETMKRNASWIVTIEGHCDERGTAEYNLALGERRAVAVRAYLVGLGTPAERLRTVSYGKEFPFDPGHDESSMAKNRRAHFVITSK